MKKKQSVHLTPALSPARRGSEPAGEGQIPAEQPFLDKKTVGRLLMLSPRTVSEMANEGRLPAYRIGIYLRFKWVDVDQFITANCKVRAGLAIDSKTFSTPHPVPLPVRGGEGMNLGRCL